VTTAAERYPRHRPHPRGHQLHSTRLLVCARAGYQCEDCGLYFPPPAGWDGSTALLLYFACRRTSRHPMSWFTIRLELGHNVSWLDGGWFEPGNLIALCTPCNIAQGRRARA
jgi:5-methylcytosine-specific restriction endonuclease McrA